jgi:kynurenine formamidase
VPDQGESEVKRITIAAIGASSALLCATLAAADPAGAPSLNDVYATLTSKRFVDLTHAFGPTTPHWKGFGEETVKTLYTIKKDGFIVQQFTHVGQWGTHVDPPAHFHEGLRTVDQIPPKEMLLPLVVIDVHEKVAANPDYTLTLEDVHAWEAKHGRIPEHAFVAMRTDWSKRWPNQDAMQNRDAAGVAHYPGWSKPVLKLLYEDRKITASGHETTDTDPGVATTKEDYSLESYILGLNHYQIEMLANLDQVPEAGALLMVSWPKPEGGTGFPARVIAIAP